MAAAHEELAQALLQEVVLVGAGVGAQHGGLVEVIRVLAASPPVPQTTTTPNSHHPGP